MDAETVGAVGVRILTNIQSRLTTFPPTMRRVADVVLSRPQIVVEYTITELARACDTSEATILRFSRSLGFSGYPSLRLQLAAELGKEAAESEGQRSSSGFGSDITPGDTLGDMISKIAMNEILGIRETLDGLNLDVLQQVIDRIENAKRVVSFGIGASNVGAQDLAAKLLRIGYGALAFHDAHDALASAVLLGPWDVAVGLSHSGRTRETIAFLDAAHRGGAYTVALTNAPESPVGTVADAVLRTAVRETMFRSSAMASRIAQLTIVDYIFVGVARGRYERTIQALKMTHDIVQQLRLES